MPNTPTPRLGLHRPSGGDPADVPRDIGRLADRLDGVALGYDQGSALPAFGTAGRLFYVTTTRTLYYDFGGGWVPFGWQPGDIRWTGAWQSPGIGWLPADGSAQDGNLYTALFAAIGTRFGGAGSSFTLPDLRGRVPVGVGGGRTLGERGGAEAVTLTAAQSGLPEHHHHMESVSFGGVQPHIWRSGNKDYVRGDQHAGGTATSLVIRGDGTFAFGIGVGGVTDGAKPAAAAHTNMQPYTVLNAWIKT